MKLYEVESEFEIAYRIASEAHKNQKDLSGDPYMNHINAVIANVHGEKEKCVAALHDVVEDYRDVWSLDRLRDEGISEEVVAAVDAITKRPGEKYKAYLHRVKANALATAVKKEDIKNNMDLSRLQGKKEIKQVDLDRVNKYKNALKFLES